MSPTTLTRAVDNYEAGLDRYGGRELGRFTGAVKVVRAMRLDNAAHSIAGSIYAVDTDEPVFHLTFDDGPHPDVTPDVLEVLDRYDVKATFFVLTQESLAYPDILADTIARGHTIGLHTRTHPRLPTVSWRRLFDEIVTAKRDLESLTRQPVRWFRPPYGAIGLRSIPLVRSAGMESVLWSADTHDYEGLEPSDPLRFLGPEISTGGIALIHDVPTTDTVEEDHARGYVPKADLTEHILTELRHRGLTPLPLDALLCAGRVRRKLTLA